MLIISGLMHSGTSLIASILNTSEKIELMFENKLILTYVESIKKEEEKTKSQGRILANKVLIQTFPDISFEEVNEKFDNTKFLFVVRDPRDTTLSALDRSGQGFQWSCFWWKRQFLIIKYLELTIGKEKVLTYRQEDLLSNPVKKLNQICDFIGISYSDSLFNFKMLHNGWREQYGNSINRDLAYKWKKDKRIDLIKDIENRIGEDIIRGVGYDMSS